jgi:hypothetical protein
MAFGMQARLAVIICRSRQEPTTYRQTLRRPLLLHPRLRTLHFYSTTVLVIFEWDRLCLVTWNGWKVYFSTFWFYLVNSIQSWTILIQKICLMILHLTVKLVIFLSIFNAPYMYRKFNVTVNLFFLHSALTTAPAVSTSLPSAENRTPVRGGRRSFCRTRPLSGPRPKTNFAAPLFTVGVFLFGASSSAFSRGYVTRRRRGLGIGGDRLVSQGPILRQFVSSAVSESQSLRCSALHMWVRFCFWNRKWRDHAVMTDELAFGVWNNLSYW